MIDNADNTWLDQNKDFDLMDEVSVPSHRYCIEDASLIIEH